MVYCVAFGCSNSSKNNSSMMSGISFFRFPSDQNYRKRWIHNIKRNNFKPSKHSRVCSAHFESDSYERDARKLALYGYVGGRNALKTDAIPTIFSFPSVQPKAIKERGASKKRKRRETLEDLGLLQSGESPKDENTLPVAVAVGFQETDHRAGATQTATKAVQANNKPYMRTRRLQFRGQTKDKAVQVNTVAKTVRILSSHAEGSDEDEQSENGNTERQAEDPDDLDYSPSETETDSEPGSDTEEETEELPFPSSSDPMLERQILVSENCLMELLSVCRTCGNQTQVCQKRKAGTLLVLEAVCEKGHRFSWNSQQMHRGLPLGNLNIAAATLFSGSSASKVKTFLDHFNTPTISRRTYHMIQKHYLVPTVSEVWQQEQDKILNSRIGKPLVIGGDGRCDSPGFSAKYGSYNIMDLETKTILHTELVQSNEVKSSVHMELEGLKRTIKLLEDKRCQIQDLVTDRHVQIKKYMREEQSSVNHYFDVWHVSKSVTKKLEQGSKKKKYQQLQPWVKSIGNHLFWVAGSSGNDGEQKQAKWLSLLNHVANIHTGHGDSFPNCEHGELDAEREWLTKGSRPYKYLEEIVTKKQLVKDISKLSPVHQTYYLEVFHNVVNHFASKQQHYFYGAMQCRMYLAALHFNENNNLEQKTTKDGELQWVVCFPKAQKGKAAVIKPVKIEPSYEYIDRLKTAVMDRRLRLTSYMSARKEVLTNTPCSLASGYIPVSKPDLIAKHRSRFQNMN